MNYYKAPNSGAKPKCTCGSCKRCKRREYFRNYMRAHYIPHPRRGKWPNQYTGIKRRITMNENDKELFERYRRMYNNTLS